jgi:DUF3102 family protein
MTDPARSNSLADLAARIRIEHEACRQALKHGLEHAIAAGELLIEAKKQLKHGQWLPWLREHCRTPERTARHYMRLAKHKEQIGNIADLTVTEAVAALAPISPSPLMLETFLHELAEIDERIEFSFSPPGMKFPDNLSREAWLAVGRLLAHTFPTVAWPEGQS